MSFPQFSKVLALGHREIRDIFEGGEVEITEKVDGSQFGFTKQQGIVQSRSKNRVLDMDRPDNLFMAAVEQVQRIKHLIPEGYKFYAEYLNKPKHNVIAYDRYPTNHLVVFGMDCVNPGFNFTGAELCHWAEVFGFDIVPLLFQGQLPNGVEPEFVEQLLATDSYLGGSKIEGFVVKNWNKSVQLPHALCWPMCGKFVSEKFKEKMGQRPQSIKQGSWLAMKNQYQTKARWQKAIQHMKEDGKLLGEPKDIGPLVKAIQQDIVEECKDEIMVELWSVFHKELLSHSIRGFPEFYKRQLLEGEIDG